MLLGKLGKFEEAQDIYGDILQGYDQALGEDHPSTLDIVSLLAMLHKVGDPSCLLLSAVTNIQYIPPYTSLLIYPSLIPPLVHPPSLPLSLTLIFMLAINPIACCTIRTMGIWMGQEASTNGH